MSFLDGGKCLDDDNEMTLQVTITGFDLNSYRQSLEKWNAAIQLMSAQCDAVGPASCLPVRDL